MRISIAAALLAAALPAVYLDRAFAGRPFATEDAGVLEPGTCEIETYGAYTDSRLDPAERGASFQVGCGPGAGTQLAVVVARFRSVDTRHSTVGINGKTALRPLTETETGVAVAYSLQGVRQPGGGLRREEAALALVVTVPRDRTLLHANLGVVRTQSDARTVASYAFAAERLGETGFDIGLEVFGQGGERPWIGTGARYALRPERMFVDASLAVQARGARGRQLSAGLKYVF